MPEGPEIRRSADHLSSLLVGKKIVNAFVGKTGRYVKSPPEGYDSFLDDVRSRQPSTITSIDCKGKFMWWVIQFDSQVNRSDPSWIDRLEKTWYLWCTYGMSGQWSPKETQHTAFQVYYHDTGDMIDASGTFNSPGSLCFNDPRHFGTLKFVDDKEAHLKKLATLGPDMLSDPPDEPTFVDRLYRRDTRTIVEALMDQSVVSGVGNYVKAEALYLAEISPHRRVDSLTSLEISRLRQQIINVMRASYRTGGATINTYRNPDGSEGRAQSRFVVYGNKTDPMGHPVLKEETLDGRTTHWVPQVQK